MVLSQAGKEDKKEVVQQVAQNWIEVGEKQYQRGFYEAAEQSFLRAEDYKEFLTAAERQKLKEYIEKAHSAAVERKSIQEHIQTADGLVKQNELIKAKAHLETAQGSKLLTEEERQLITKKLKEIDNRLGGQKEEIAGIYKESVELYKAGQLEKARDGFLKVAKSGLLTAPQGETAEDYLVKIDKTLAVEVKPSVSKQEKEAKPAEKVSDTAAETVIEDKLLEASAEPAQKVQAQPTQKPSTSMAVAAGETKVAEVKVAGAATSENDYIEVVNRKRSIVQGHTKAVVADAQTKAQTYMSKGEFEKAREAVEAAERTVNENSLQLGDYLFKQYTGQLKQLSEQISQGQAERDRQIGEQKQLKAVESQRRYKEQMTTEREKRVADLMENALAYQKQQRYQEALGQLEILLAIDPQNEKALVLKQTLDDMTGFQKQLELQKGSDKEKVGILLETKESEIPYAGELTHPKNWREIVAKPTRQGEEAIGQDPANVVVYKQLDEVVNLTGLSPEMPFGEAIEEIRNAVTPPLKIVVLWKDLSDNAGIDQTTPINMDAISAVPLKAAMELLLKSVSGGLTELGYIVDNGVITIATKSSLPSKLETMVYDVSVLLGRPADFYAPTGSGGGGGGGQSGGGQFFAEYFENEETELDRTQLIQEATVRGNSLVTLIQNTVEPDSWYDAGGEGTITLYETKKLIVRQTREVHNKVEKLLKEMRKSLGEQISIEARFLVVGENFLNDVGLDMDLGFKWQGGLIAVNQQSYDLSIPESTGIKGSMGSVIGGASYTPAIDTAPGFGGSILNDLQASFMIRATQGHKDSKALTAPKVTVLSGESASFRVQQTIRFPMQPDTGTAATTLGGGSAGTMTTTVTQNYGSIPTGTVLNITPTITPDKKHVLLNIVAELRTLLDWETTTIQIPLAGAPSYDITLPQTEISRVKTRVSVPDGGTLLLGGQKLTAEAEKEVGVPVLSKIPLLGRAFDNRSKIKDQKILLILVKPTIILQEERDDEAMNAVEEGNL